MSTVPSGIIGCDLCDRTGWRIASFANSSFPIMRRVLITIHPAVSKIFLVDRKDGVPIWEVINDQCFPGVAIAFTDHNSNALVAHIGARWMFRNFRQVFKLTLPNVRLVIDRSC